MKLSRSAASMAAAGLWVATAGISLLTLGGFFGRMWYYLELASHFRMQYGAGLGACTLGFALLRRRWGVVVAGLFTLVNLGAALPLLAQPARAGSVEGQHYRLLLANVLQPNQNYYALADIIRESEPDLVLLVEINRDWLRSLEDVLDAYPYREEAPREDHFGIALYSRLPLHQSETLNFGLLRHPTIVASLENGSKAWRLVLTHPPPPKSPQGARNRNRHMNDLAGFVQAQNGSLLLCGDLNMSPWSPYFSDFLQKSGLQDSSRGFGVQPTWPAAFPPLRVPLDHCLVSDDVVVRNRRVGLQFGSDHLPVILDFSFR